MGPTVLTLLRTSELMHDRVVLLLHCLGDRLIFQLPPFKAWSVSSGCVRFYICFRLQNQKVKSAESDVESDNPVATEHR